MINKLNRRLFLGALAASAPVVTGLSLLTQKGTARTPTLTNPMTELKSLNPVLIGHEACQLLGQQLCIHDDLPLVILDGEFAVPGNRIGYTYNYKSSLGKMYPTKVETLRGCDFTVGDADVRLSLEKFSDIHLVPAITAIVDGIIEDVRKHKAQAIVFARLERPGGMIWSEEICDPRIGISVRLIRGYIRDDIILTRLDVLYGLISDKA